MNTAIRYGLIYAGISIGISLLTFGLGIEKDDTVQTVNKFVNVIIPAVIIFLGIKEKRDKESNGFITFGSGFKAGMVITFIGGLITAAFTFLYMTVLNPGIVTYIKMKQEEELVNRGMSDAQIEKMAPNLEIWTTPGMVTVFAFVGIIVLGLVISLIMSAILKKENPTEMV